MRTLRHATLALPVVVWAQTAHGPLAAVAELSPAAVTMEHGELTIELPPVDVPPRGDRGAGMAVTPLLQVAIPVTASLYQFHAEVVDAGGGRLPRQVLHHVNLTDPSRRELFLPTSLHLVAASKETPDLAVPPLLFGMPVRKGDRYIVSGMLANDGEQPIHGARLRLVYRYMPAWAPGPLFDAYPWVMDVMFPLGSGSHGSKAFDLPPGRTRRSWESRPAIAGTLVGLGGHLHDYGVGLTLEDVTTGEVLWRGVPVRDAAGVVHSVPVYRFYRWNRLGAHIEPSHVYRATAEYDNPTGQLIPDGGMGAIAGMFVPDRGQPWPPVDPRDSIYVKDLEISIHNASEPAAHVMHGHH